MSKTFTSIDDDLGAFLARQAIFFVASAPLSATGHVNLSPKGLDTFRVLSPTQVAYLDLTGSGVETIAHVKENRRLTIMFCAFSGPPRIVRLYGHGEALEPGHADFEALLPRFPEQPGTRAIIRLTVQQIADSCGYAVPRFELVEERKQLELWAERKGEAGLADYRAQKNATSLDGLRGLESAARSNGNRRR